MIYTPMESVTFKFLISISLTNNTQILVVPISESVLTYTILSKIIFRILNIIPTNT